MASEDITSAAASTSSMDVRESPSPESTERCDLCDLAFENHVQKKAHSLSIIHHVRLETKFKPCWHRCAPCKFSCDVLADFSKHIDTEDHKKKLEKERKKWLATDQKFKAKQLMQPGLGPLTNFAVGPLRQSHPLSLSSAELVHPVPSYLNFPPGVPRFDSTRPPPPLFGMARPPLIQTASPSPTVSFLNLNFSRNTPRTAVPQLTPNQGRASHSFLPSPPSTSGSSTPGTTGCISKSKTKKQKPRITRDNRRSSLWADVVRTTRQTGADNRSSSTAMEKASKPSAVLIQAKRRTDAANDTVSAKRRKILAEADSTTPLRVGRPPTAIMMPNPESTAAKQSRWEKIALKSQALFQKTKSARMLKERLQKYRLVKPSTEGASSSDSQAGAYHHFESPNAPTTTASSSLSTSTSSSTRIAILEEALSEIISSPVNSTALFEYDWQQVVQEVDEAVVNSMEDLCFMSPVPSTLRQPNHLEAASPPHHRHLTSPPVSTLSNQEPLKPPVPVQSASVVAGSQVAHADSLMMKGDGAVKVEPMRVKEEPLCDEEEIIVTQQRVPSQRPAPVSSSLPSQVTNRALAPSACVAGGMARSVTSAKIWPPPTAPTSSSFSAIAQPKSTTVSTNPGSRKLEELWLICQQEQQKSCALAEAKQRIERLQNQLNDAVREKLELESDLLSITSRKKDLLSLGTNDNPGDDSLRWFVLRFGF